MNIQIKVNGGAQIINFELAAPSREIAEKILRDLIAARGGIVVLDQGGGKQLLINTSLLIMATLVEQ